MRAKFINEIKHLTPKSEEEISASFEEALQDAIDDGGVETPMGEFISIDFDTLEASIEIQYDGWDSIKQAQRDIRWWTKGDNDSLGDDIEENLLEIGYCIDYDKKMIMDDMGDCASVDFYIKKRDFMNEAIKHLKPFENAEWIFPDSREAGRYVKNNLLELTGFSEIELDPNDDEMMHPKLAKKLENWYKTNKHKIADESEDDYWDEFIDWEDLQRRKESMDYWKDRHQKNTWG